MNLNIYGHGGSTNHGNEAIVRGVHTLFPEVKLILYSHKPDIDEKFELGDVCEIRAAKLVIKKYSIINLIQKFLSKYFSNFYKHSFQPRFYKHQFNPQFKKIKKEELYLLEAGDQYFVGETHRKWLAYMNSMINNLGGKTIMLGCTIDKEILKQKGVIDDLNNYSLIIARESITYNSLVESNIKTKIILAPDSAFLVNSKKITLPDIFLDAAVIGINSGFLQQGNEIYYNLMIENTIKLIKYILDSTSYKIALIPHVHWNDKKSDIRTLELLKNHFSDSDRIELIDEKASNKQKYLMSQCKFMVALRTHAAISSIGSQVPTLITGYKIKSSGIYNDIFPKHFQLLAHVQSLSTDNVFTEKFKWMIDNELEIRKYMKEKIPKYIEETKLIRQELLELVAK